MLQCTLAEIGPAKLTVRSVFWLRISRHGLNCDDIAVEVADPKLCFYSYCSGSQSALNGGVCVRSGSVKSARGAFPRGMYGE